MYKILPGKLSVSLTIMLCVLSGTVVKAQTIRYVDSTSTITGAGGNNWATASNDFQATVNASAAGDQVWVKKGTYIPASGASFSMKEGVAIYGGFEGVETQLSQRNYNTNITAFKGNGSRVFYHNFIGLTPSAILDGFTIRNGTMNDYPSTGAGMYNYYCSPTISNCIFTNNTISTALGSIGGGAIYNLQFSAPVITNCTFTNNTVSSSQGSYGGAIYNRNSSPTINGCIFSNNFASAGGGAIDNDFSSSPVITNSTFNANRAAYGGGVSIANGSPVITGCTFNNNIANGAADGFGGGIYNGSNSAPIISNCVFRNNTATKFGAGMSNYSTTATISNCVFTSNVVTPGGAYYGGGAMFTSYSTAALKITNCIFSYNSSGGSNSYGGGMFNLSAHPTITNCIFTHNSALNTGYGGAMYNRSSSPVITNCTFGNNVAMGTSGNGGAFSNHESSAPTIANSIIYGNTSAGVQINNASGTAAISYSLVQGGYAGTGNINTNPLFVNTANPIGPDSIWNTADDGLRLLICGPSVNAGNNAAVPVGITTDISGAARIQQSIVDMGAYEGGVLHTVTWLGITDYWAEAGNWSDGNIPDACKHVIINNGTPFMPKVTGNQICYKLTVNSGSTVTIIGGANLQVVGK